VTRRPRVLMLAPAFAPQGNSEAIVNGKLALAMLNAGWEIEVIARAPSLEVAYDYGGAWAEPWHPLRPLVHEITAPAWRTPRRLWDLVHSAVRMHYLLDGLRWASRAYDLAARLHERRPFDVVLSRAFPEVAHLPAMKLTRNFGLPWVANWNDPWDFLGRGNAAESFSRAIGTFEARLCKAVAATASWLTFPCEGLRVSMVSYLGTRAAKRSSVIPHAALERPKGHVLQPAREFLVTHLGRVWRERNPEAVFEAFGRFLKTSDGNGASRLRFAGIPDFDLGVLAKRSGLGSRFVDLGRCTYLESLRLMGESAVLLLIDSADFADIVLTGKAADYAYSGRPIMAITSPNSEIARLIRNQGGGLVVTKPSVDAIAAAFGGLFQNWKADTLQQSYGSTRLYDAFSPAKVVAAYEDVLRQLTQAA
jgi:glycosyltransferase involved in cell wall biosynthesis